MRISPILAVTFAILAQIPVAAQEAGQFPFALTREGQMLGAVEGEVASYKGMAYAAAPLGPERWHAPRQRPESSDMQTAYDYGPACLQPSMPRASEDCLTLNVFRPFGVDGPLPVMVFVHGGDFISGTANDPLLDGAKFAQDGVILVTINYRLGAFGWGAHPVLANPPVFNIGLQDQIAALRWVHENAPAFGGDPGNVTLFGSGTGATSVALLMFCAEARGLFHKAILQSPLLRWRLLSREESETTGRQLLALAGGNKPDVDPRAIDAGRLLAAEIALLAKTPRSFGPVRDGALLAEEVLSGFAAGHQLSIPLIVGSNSDETGAGQEPDLNEELRLAEYSLDRARGIYPDAAARGQALAAELYTDRVFAEPIRQLARHHAATKAPTYRYRFAYLSEAQRAGGEGGHVRDIQFVFGAQGVSGASPFTLADREVSRLLRSYWVNFARTGDPNSPGLPHWDTAAAGDHLLLMSNDRVSSGSDPSADRLDHLLQRGSKD